MQLTITTPEGLIFEGEARQVVVPARDGELGILSRHAPLIGELGVGELRVSPAEGSGISSFFVDGGFVQVLKNRVVVLATKAGPADKIDSAEAEAELKALLDESPPKGAGIDALTARSRKIHAAKARVKIAGKAKS